MYMTNRSKSRSICDNQYLGISRWQHSAQSLFSNRRYRHNTRFMHAKTVGKRASKAITQAKTLQLATATRDRAPPPAGQKRLTGRISGTCRTLLWRSTTKSQRFCTRAPPIWFFLMLSHSREVNFEVVYQQSREIWCQRILLRVSWPP